MREKSPHLREETLISRLSYCCCTPQAWKRQSRERKARRLILSPSGWRPKATETVLHVEPTNISEVLNMKRIRPGPERKEQVKRKIQRWKEKEKGKERVGRVPLSIATRECYWNESKTSTRQVCWTYSNLLLCRALEHICVIKAETSSFQGNEHEWRGRTNECRVWKSAGSLTWIWCSSINSNMKKRERKRGRKRGRGVS